MVTIGSVQPFDVDQPRTWGTYIEQITYFCEANDIVDNNKKRATLLASYGLKTLEILCSLTAPDRPRQRTYDQLLTLLKNYFFPKPRIIYQRFQFQKRVQKVDEAVSSYFVDLRRLADDCSFGEMLPERLRDQFVCGIRDEALQKRLLAESNPKFDDCGGQKPKQSTRKFSKSSSQLKPSSGCGGAHPKSKCPHLNAKCHYCKKTGHIVRLKRHLNHQYRYNMKEKIDH
ncbi:uncharacterized protein [Centruroides vittatus]|uniref:uncharacterized protein n=1 Tax=Centruroides vittatus TaxID=120091 RepID=UPI00350EF8CE